MKTQLSLICALSRNHVIGIKNDLPWHIPEDLNHFKELTKGKPIIMGRLTYQSILTRRSGKPLPQRQHYVVTQSNLDPLPEAVQTYPTLDKAIAAARQDHPETEIMIIGGASIYEQSVSLVDKMYLTIIDRDIDGDAFFPRYAASDWFEEKRECFSQAPIPFSFITLIRK